MGVMDVVTDAASSYLGAVKKAVLIIGDKSEYKVEYQEAPKPSSGMGGGMGNVADVGQFNAKSVMGYAARSAGFSSDIDDEHFTYSGKIKSYRFEVQFNPDEITINGYGGEELPVQNYTNHRQPSLDPKNAQKKPGEDGLKSLIPGSHMASTDTRIDMNFKVYFDTTDPQDAFYSDKFTLGQSSLIKGAVNVGLTAAGKKKTSVQKEVEALNAVVRDPNKRMCIFVWGDMKYEGLLNSVNAEYTMFNVNGEPCRAVVSINMVLYDQSEYGKNIDNFKSMYNKYFYSPSPSIPSGVKMGNHV